MDREQVRAMLPKVGDRRMERPISISTGNGTGNVIPALRPCTVVYVNPEHWWYTVEFDSGLRESYKLPRVKVNPGSRREWEQ